MTVREYEALVLNLLKQIESLKGLTKRQSGELARLRELLHIKDFEELP